MTSVSDKIEFLERVFGRLDGRVRKLEGPSGAACAAAEPSEVAVLRAYGEYRLMKSHGTDDLHAMKRALIMGNTEHLKCDDHYAERGCDYIKQNALAQSLGAIRPRVEDAPLPLKYQRTCKGSVFVENERKGPRRNDSIPKPLQWEQCVEIGRDSTRNNYGRRSGDAQ